METICRKEETMHNKVEEEFLITLNRFYKLKGKMKPKDLTHGEFMVMGTINSMMKKHLIEKNSIVGVKVSKLTEQLHVTKPAVSKALRGLEEKEYVKRILDQNDKRVVYIELTPVGVAILDESRKYMGESIERIFAELGEQDTIELFRILNRLYGIMKVELVD